MRKDFIDKFWIALGWDVNHEPQKNPSEQEVKVERTVGVEGRVKRADYAFLTPNFRDVRFFVEAKKPARNIDNADDYFQTIRYGWNAQAPSPPSRNSRRSAFAYPVAPRNVERVC